MYLYSLCLSSVRVLGCTLLFTLRGWAGLATMWLLHLFCLRSSSFVTSIIL
jgi:hypothetical protein